ncbi:MAG: hypothetical protein ABI054_10315, partial [Planctomycetota bacterium]
MLLAASLLAVLCLLAIWLTARALDTTEEKFTPRHPGYFDRDEWFWLLGAKRPIGERRGMLDDLKAKHLRP